MNFVSIFGGTELLTDLTAVSTSLNMHGLNMLPQPRPDFGLPATGDALPPS